MVGKIDYRNLMTVKQLVEHGVAFSEGTIKRWLFDRNKNGLNYAVVAIKESLLIDALKFNIWLSLDKDEVSEFQNLRTKEQIVEESWFDLSKLEYWLKNRHWNGLTDAVISKSRRRLYIDILKLNKWFLDQNMNSHYGYLVK